jgi:hypothetical protein
MKLLRDCINTQIYIYALPKEIIITPASAHFSGFEFARDEKRFIFETKTFHLMMDEIYLSVDAWAKHVEEERYTDVLSDVMKRIEGLWGHDINVVVAARHVLDSLHSAHLPQEDLQPQCHEDAEGGKQEGGSSQQYCKLTKMVLHYVEVFIGDLSLLTVKVEEKVLEESPPEIKEKVEEEIVIEDREEEEMVPSIVSTPGAAPVSVKVKSPLPPIKRDLVYNRLYSNASRVSKERKRIIQAPQFILPFASSDPLAEVLLPPKPRFKSSVYKPLPIYHPPSNTTNNPNTRGKASVEQSIPPDPVKPMSRVQSNNRSRDLEWEPAPHSTLDRGAPLSSRSTVPSINKHRKLSMR